MNYKLFELVVGLPLRNFPAYYSSYSEFIIRHQLMQKLVKNWKYVRNNCNVCLYVMERETGFIHIMGKSLQSCHLSINVYLQPYYALMATWVDGIRCTGFVSCPSGGSLVFNL